MAVIDNVLRQHRWQLDERQRYLNDLEALAVRLRGDARRMDSELERATQHGRGGLGTHPGGIDPVFLIPLIERRDKLNHSVAELDKQIAEARTFVESAQQELRVYESSSSQRERAIPLQPLTRRSRRLQQSRLQQGRRHRDPASREGDI